MFSSLFKCNQQPQPTVLFSHMVVWQDPVGISDLEQAIKMIDSSLLVYTNTVFPAVFYSGGLSPDRKSDPTNR